MTARIGAATRVFALLGDPVEHSLSPVIQNAAFEAAGADGVYVALRSAPDDVGPLIDGLARAGGGGNVTLPHKEIAARSVEVPTDAVARTGACNTYWWEGGRILGDNTDVEGFRRALRTLLGGPPVGRRVLLAGAGGAARAVVLALLAERVDQVQVLNRTPERARDLVARFQDGRVAVLAEEPTGDWDLLVNATRLGLHADDPLPVDLHRLGDLGAVMDLTYGPSETRLVRIARERGLPAADGGEMLVQQGAAAFERWWGREAPVSVMRDALAGARVG